MHTHTRRRKNVMVGANLPPPELNRVNSKYEIYEIPCSGCPLPGAKKDVDPPLPVSDLDLLPILILFPIPLLSLIAAPPLLRNPHDRRGLALPNSHWHSLLHVAQVLLRLPLSTRLSSRRPHLPSRGPNLSHRDNELGKVLTFSSLSGLERDCEDIPGIRG